MHDVTDPNMKTRREGVCLQINLLPFTNWQAFSADFLEWEVGRASLCMVPFPSSLPPPEVNKPTVLVCAASESDCLCLAEKVCVWAGGAAGFGVSALWAQRVMCLWMDSESPETLSLAYFKSKSTVECGEFVALASSPLFGGFYYSIMALQSAAAAQCRSLDYIIIYYKWHIIVKQ